MVRSGSIIVLLLLLISRAALCADRCAARLEGAGWNLDDLVIERRSLRETIAQITVRLVLYETAFNYQSDPKLRSSVAARIDHWLGRVERARSLTDGSRERFVAILDQAQISTTPGRVLALELRSWEGKAVTAMRAHYPGEDASAVEQERKDLMLKILSTPAETVLKEFDDALTTLSKISDQPAVYYGIQKVHLRYPHVHALCLIATRNFHFSCDEQVRRVKNGGDTFGMSDGTFGDFLNASKLPYWHLLVRYAVATDPLWRIWDVPTLNALLNDPEKFIND